MHNLPISMFAFFNQKILQKTQIYIKDIADIKEKDITTYQTLKEWSIKSKYIIWLYDAKWHSILLFGLDFVSKNKELDSKDIECLKDLSYKIAWILY